MFISSDLEEPGNEEDSHLTDDVSSGLQNHSENIPSISGCTHGKGGEDSDRNATSTKGEFTGSLQSSNPMGKNDVVNNPEGGMVPPPVNSPHAEENTNLATMASNNPSPTKSASSVEPGPPLWVGDAADHLYLLSSMDGWVSLIEGWLDMEATLGYPEGKVSV